MEVNGDKGFPYEDEDRDDALIKALNHNNRLAVAALPSPEVPK
jgi:hypothetical protein